MEDTKPLEKGGVVQAGRGDNGVRKTGAHKPCRLEDCSRTDSGSHVPEPLTGKSRVLTTKDSVLCSLKCRPVIHVVPGVVALFFGLCAQQVVLSDTRGILLKLLQIPGGLGAASIVLHTGSWFSLLNCHSVLGLL